MVTLYSQNTITNKTPETKPKTWTSIEKKKKITQIPYYYGYYDLKEVTKILFL